MTQLQALIGALVMAALAVTGVAGLAGPWWACIAGAVLVGATVVLLYDPAKANEARRRRMARIRAGKQK